MRTLIIPGKLPGLNELIAKERTHRQMGANLKRQAEATVRWEIRQQFRKYRPKTPITILYHYFEPTRRRDKDNIAGFAHKVIQDSLVKEGVIANDGWDYVRGFADSFDIDKTNPRIEVTILEKGEQYNA